MKSPSTKSALLFCIFSLLVFFHTATGYAGLPPAEVQRLGEQMYRSGILPSGTLMPAFIRGDVEVDSSAFSCSSCHLRAGLGSYEGGIITPPTTGNKLYQPYQRPPSFKNLKEQAGRDFYAETVIERPPYTRDTLAHAMRFGVDPAGQVFNDVMPRYPLSDADMDLLIAYLEQLSAQPSPGASTQEFRFATIITDDVSRADRDALLQPLQIFIEQKNQQLAMYNDFIKFGYTPTAEMEFAFRRAALDVWELKGPPATWQAQLAAYYAANPVFAILGGISNQDWRPIHDFCETMRLPNLFPITDFPVVSGTGWYTLYFNKGYAQEGEAAARHINRSESLSAALVLQVIQDTPAGRALAEGFNRTWQELERTAVTSVTLSEKQLSDPKNLSTLISKHKPGVLLLWTDAGLLKPLAKLQPKLSSPGTVFMSSGYLGARALELPDALRSKVLLPYPYRLTPFVGTKEGGFDARIPILSSFADLGDRRIATRTASMLTQTTLRGLNLIYDNLFRDHLLDVMSMQMDQTVRDYERLSFGPGQRFASKGCYIIQLGPGKEPALIPRSEWVIH